MTIRMEGVEEVRESLGKVASQLPYVMAVSLTKTAQAAKADLRQEMVRVFDRPTPYTLNSLYIQPATKQRLMSRVYIKDEAGKGNPATKFILPEVEGGKRSLKGFEVALQRRGVLPAGMYCVPGAGVKLDRYGNIPGSTIVQILSYFKAFSEVGFTANITAKGKAKKLKKGTAYFAITKEGGHLAPGIYHRASSAWGAPIKPIIMFVRQPGYRTRFRFYDVGQRSADRNWRGIFNGVLDEALRTAK
jgi:hypothetical protein